MNEFTAKAGSRSFLLLFVMPLLFAFGVLIEGCTEGKSSTASLTGKKMYLPTEGETELDKETGLTVIKNIINIMVAPGTEPDVIEQIALSVGGEIVGYDIDNNLYQIKVEVADLAALDAIALKLLGEHKSVEVASKCSVSVHKDPYYIR